MKFFITFLIITLIAGGVTYFVVKDFNNQRKDNSSNSVQTEDPKESNSQSENKLDYSNQNLTDFPKEVLSNRFATELDLSGNSLTGAIPAEIKDMKNLEVLNISNNKMTGIPAEIGRLNNLRILNYSNNEITSLPLELGNLQNLEVFDLSGNNPAEQDLQSIKEQLPSSTEIIL